LNEYAIHLNDADLAAIDAALQNAPFRVAYPLIQKINTQISAAKTPTEKAPRTARAKVTKP